jgi:hypothetical protein
MLHNAMTSAGDHSTWHFLGADGKPGELTHSPRFSTDDLFTLRRATLQGIGAVLVATALISAVTRAIVAAQNVGPRLVSAVPWLLKR